MPIAKSTRVGPYEVISPLGSGGMGEVYLAHDTNLYRKVALKILPVQLAADSARLRRFNQEAMAAAALSHPNIAHIYEIGDANGTNFIAMEYIDGVTLREKIHRDHTELKKLLRYLEQVAEGLAQAHAAGIVHRDLKPDNVMITREGYAKILDFGLAKVTESAKPTAINVSGEEPTAVLQQPLSTPGVVMGTAGYMSPEQAQGKPLDHRSDIFSFGCLLYEAVTGNRAFQSESTIDTLHKIVHDSVPAVKDANPSAPSDLTRVVRRCLAKDPDDRYQSIKEAAIELRELRRELEGSRQLDTTVPSASSGSSVVSDSGAGRPLPISQSAAAGSSADHIWSHYKIHVALLLLILVGGVVALSWYVRTPKSQSAIDSIAVLPFSNENADPNTDFLSDGITESVINSLSQIGQLKVMARSTIFQYKGKQVDPRQVGRDLHVSSVLTGRLIQQGDRLTVRTELVKVADGTELWGQQYNRKLSDVFAVQEDIAREITDKLRVKLSGAERQQLTKRPTENLKAFQYYMEGRAYTSRRTREDLMTAVNYCEKAIDEDPNYALAYAGLAEAYVALGLRGYIAPVEARRKSEDASHKALSIDANLPEAHALAGYTETAFAPFNFPEGDSEMRRAIELSPSLAVAHQYLGLSLDRQGRLDEAQTEISKAHEMDPLSSSIARSLAASYYLKRDYSRALEQLRRANELGPPFSITLEIGIYTRSRSYDEAESELQKAQRERKDDPLLIYSAGALAAARGKRTEALAVIKELEDMSGPNLDQAMYIAKIYAILNDNVMAFSWLDRGVTAGSIGIFYKDEPIWDAIRNDRRFAELLQRMGVPSEPVIDSG